jgi:peptidoglycan/LPS O-acetylase OafA/YrhL
MKAGELSVALYLTHVPWLLGASLLITPARFPGAWGWLGVALLAGGAVALSWVTFALVERPLQGLMHRMVRRPATAVAS